ncbi:alcohol dehydrogenase [Paracidovorax avenae]|uniref:cytochrome c n=2 Tax=Paracidovorax avenae TaxID=80867 RepID=UPI000D16D2F5|nr:cytochrome c [Paracidovorax avenae]AVS91283.1 alcohol dehydrogenase [Paracidovorax avenae]AVT18299.1 alcohol dehydrogenase [Paracidovorax avenae]
MNGPPPHARSFWRRWPARVGAVLLGGLAACAVLVAVLNRWGETPLPQDDGPPAPATPQAIARGEYLARAGNCMACHTEPGGAPFAGGRGIETPFGMVYSTNLTPDPDTGLGRWSDAAFWRALHHGRSRDGRLLYPAFPYPSYTHVTREDADAIHAYLRSLPPVRQAARPHALGFPYGTQAALAVWRALFFRPGGLAPVPERPADWNRGRYLVQGLGHCAACHSPRNALGATRDAGALRGGLIPVQNWYAPALDTVREAGVADWPVDEVVALLRDGTAPRGTVTGPMAEVVFRSTQYLDDADLRAIAAYLRALPAPEGPAPAAPPPPSRPVMERGGAVYARHCAQCHGDGGLGRPGAFPPLAGNRAVLLESPVNVVRTILQGGYPPVTHGNPRPHGMPPFTQVLGDDDVAAVATFVRNAWGNRAPGVGTIDVYRARERRGR